MLDFRPDLDPRTPGNLTLVDELLPSVRGYLPAYAEVSYGPPFTYTLVAGETWPNVCFASRWNSQAGGIVIVGTNKRLNVLSPTAGYINVSHAAGDYVLGAVPFMFGEDDTGVFDLCAFGDVIIAANKSVTAQKRDALDLTGATLFTDLGNPLWTAAPTARTCCVAANFVFLGDVGNYSTVTGAGDILAWSALGDHTDWRVNPQVTQCSYAQFVDTPGTITAVRPFRDGIIVFKANSMYRGRYVGAGPNSPIWDFERISDKVGCVGARSVVNIDSALIFVGLHDIYSYDGTYPASITQGIWEFIANQHLFVSPGARILPPLLAHFRARSSVHFHGFAMTLVWNYKYNKWGMMGLSTQTTQPVPCQTNVEHFRTMTTTGASGGVPTVTVGAEFVNLDTLYLVDGTTKNRNNAALVARSYLITGVYGQPDKLQTLNRVNPVFVTQPTTPPTTPPNGELTVSGGLTPNTQTNMGVVYMNPSFRFDFLGGNPNTVVTSSTSNFFKFRMDFRDSFYEIVDIVPRFTAAGER